MTSALWRAAALPPGTWPLVGRDAQMAALGTSLAGGGAGLVLCGPAGVGKTRLLREAIALAAAGEAHVHWSSATQATSDLPFSAVAHLVPDGAPPAADALSMFRTVSAALRADSAGRPVVLGVDDAHLLDDGSAGLVLHLAASGTATVVATVRTGEPCPDAIVALWKDELATRLEISPLDADEVRLLLEQALPGPVEHATAWRLHEVTGGNPLFLRELVRSALPGGSLLQVDGAWRWDGDVAFPALTDLVGSRIDRLAPGPREVVELVALSEPLPLSVLSASSVLDDVAAAEREGLLQHERVRDHQDLVRLVHPLYAEVLRATMPASVRRARHLTLCAAVERGAGLPRGRELQLAGWSMEAGLPVEPDLLLRAAQAAHASFDDVLATRLARAAVDAGSGLPAALVLAVALRGSGRAAEAAALLADYEPQAAASPLRHAFVVTCTETLVEDLGDAGGAARLLERAATWSPEPAWQQALTALSLPGLLATGDLEAVLSRGHALAGDADVAPATRLRALVPVGLALAEVGRLSEALALSEAGVALSAEALDDFPRGLHAAMQVRIAVLGYDGRWEEVGALAQWYYEEGNRQHAREVLGPAAFMLGLVHCEAGRLQTAQRWLSEAAGHLQVRDASGFGSPCLARLAQVHAQLGDAVAAREHLEQARARAEDRPGERRYRELDTAEVWVLAVEGDLAAAQRAALQAADAHEGRLYVQATLVHDAVRLGAPAKRHLPRLQAYADAVEGPLLDAFAAHVRALAQRDAPALEAAAAGFEAMAAHLLAAEAASAAAARHHRNGDPAAARRAAAAAAVRAGRCEGARTPALVRLDVDGGAVLTRREREVAGLAASGLSSRAIAERLVVSERTVETHLARAYDKLGVRRRDELGAVLG